MTQTRKPQTGPLALTFCMVALLAAPVHADTPPSDADKATALATVREGNRLLTSGKPEAALAKFKEAHRLVGGEKLFYNFAQAYRAMPGNEVDAYQAYQTYLDGAKTALPESLSAARAEQAEVRKKIALVTITTSPVGATVIIDGQSLGETPIARALVLAPGAHSLRITNGGYQSVDETLTLTPGQALDKDMGLSKAAAPLPPVVPVAPVVANAPPEVTPARPVPPQQTSPLPQAAPPMALAMTPGASDKGSSSPPVYRRWWFWTAVGAVVVAGVVVAATQGGGTKTEFTCPPGQSCSSL